jgi:hypothetical protein
MTPERWQQVDALDHAALARDADRRAAFLSDACGGDEALRAEADSLPGAGGPVFVRGGVGVRELRRGLAEAKERTR